MSDLSIRRHGAAHARRLGLRMARRWHIEQYLEIRKARLKP